MAFDPSVISQIADYAPNPVKAKGDAYTLANMADTNTLNKMKLSDIKQKQEEEEKYKQILKGRDWSTDKGATETAAAITQAGLPERAMQFIKERQAIQGGALDNQMKMLAVKENQQTALMGAMDYVHRTVDDYKASNPNATPAEVDAKNQELVTATMDQLSKERPDLIPAIDQYKKEPGALTYNGVVTHMAKGKEGLARLKQHIEEQKSARDDKRADIAQQQANTQAVNAATSARREEAYAKNIESLTKLRDPDLLDDKTLEIALPSVMADPNRVYDYTKGRGQAAGPVKKQINDAIADRMKLVGMKPEDLVKLRASAKGEFASIGKMTGQVDQMTSFEGLAKFNGKRLLELVDKLDDTNIPLIEGPSRLAKQKFGSEDAKEFGMVLQSFQSEAARILNTPNMTGVLTEGARQDMQHVIDGSVTAGQAHRVIDRAVAEMDVRKALFLEQIKTAGNALTPAFGGDTPPQGSQAPTAAPPASGSPAATAPPTVPPYDPKNPGVSLGWKK